MNLRILQFCNIHADTKIHDLPAALLQLDPAHLHPPDTAALPHTNPVDHIKRLTLLCFLRNDPAHLSAILRQNVGDVPPLIIFSLLLRKLAKLIIHMDDCQFLICNKLYNASRNCRICRIQCRL